MNNMTTFDECKEVYKKYCQYKEAAEQNVYPLLGIYDYYIERGEHNMANAICAQLLFLQSQDASKQINIYINSPGGVVTAGLAILDTMNYVTCPIATYCIGQAASMGAVLLSAGNKGLRYALPNARIMVH